MSLLIAASAAPLSQTEFARSIDQEFVDGSAIAPSLYTVATRLVSDTESLPGGDVAYPIHEALNWRMTRFGTTARASLSALLLVNEDGSCWQAKLSQPIVDRNKHKLRKYEAPVGNGSRVYLPAVPLDIRRRIGQRYGVEVPLTGSFWNWVEQHPELPLIPTEGGKKGLALLSQGFIPLPLYGVNGGYHKLPADGIALIPDVARFAKNGRSFVLAFDQDEKDATRRRVAIAIHRFGGLLLRQGCPVQVACWKFAQGKGVDDLIAVSGAVAWESAYTSAFALSHWQIWQQLEQRLTYQPALQVAVRDLSSLDLNEVPAEGIVAIASPKGSGKTKFTAQLIADSERAIAGGHRISLMRNLSTRLKLDYKGDLDKVGGQFITGSSYTLRVGLCVDSLLSLDPAKFTGCDLILDEVVQVIRHLLTSSTCARDGKRPALLARFRELMRVARRIIVADADLDNATLAYLQELRGKDSPLFLIRNDYATAGYNVRFLQAADRSAITAELLTDAQTLAAGKVLFVATDSKGSSKAIARLLSKQCPELRILLINSETSGGEWEREFMTTPDAVLERHEYDVIICSPSVATGVSIEAQGTIAKVYGIFTGASSTDADMAQALGRVREAVPRVVWCVSYGRNFCKVSRSTNWLELKSHLQAATSATISLIRASLQEDLSAQLRQDYDWQGDPNLNLYCQLSAEQNLAMMHLQEALLVRLRFEGNIVVVEECATNGAIKSLLAIAKQEQRKLDAAAIAAADDLTYPEIQRLEQKEATSHEEGLAIAKFYLKDFYCLETLTFDAVLQDNEGRWRGEILSLEAQLFPDLAEDRTAKALERRASWNQGICPWDTSFASLRRQVRAAIGLNELIAQMQTGWQWTRYDLAPYATRARAIAQQIKVALHFTIPDVPMGDKRYMSDVQVIHQLLSQLGVKVTQAQWSNHVAGHEGTKLRVYRLDMQHWQQVWNILQRRQEKRQRLNQAETAPLRSPLKQDQILYRTGDPPLLQESELADIDNASEWFSEEAIADVQSWIQSAANDPIVLDSIRQMISDVVWQRLYLQIKLSNSLLDN